MPKTVSLDGRLEACGGAHYWARRFIEHGHTVRLTNPKFVKPFVKSNKNDWNDAAAICEAAQRPTMGFVAPKTIYQQECMALHRIRQRPVMQRTAIVNQARGLLQEHGVVIANGIGCVRRELPRILEDASNELTPRMRVLLAALAAELRSQANHTA
jgi:transposase